MGYPAQAVIIAMRCFVAVELPDSARAAILASLPAGCESNADLRWTTPGQWHVTLGFFARLDMEQVERLIRSVRDVSLRMRPCELTLSQLGAFPNLRRPRVLWRGVEDGGSLREWVRQAERAWRDLPGEASPDRFTPHVTLARAKTPAGQALARKFLAGSQSLAQARWTARHVSVFESRPGPAGARYNRLEHAPLGAEDGSY